MVSEALPRLSLGTGLTLSVVLHVSALAVIALRPLRPSDPPPVVSFAVLDEAEPEPDPVAPPPEPEPEPEPEAPEPEPEPVAPPPKRVQRPKPTKAPVPEEPTKPATEEPPAAAQESPADFTGTTLTNDGPGEGWVSAVGSGAAMDAPIGTPGVVTGRKRAGVAGGAIGGTGTGVAQRSDLSRMPVAPDSRKLNDALTRNYPKLAKQRGIEGKSVIRLRVLASGKLQVLNTISETYPGFAKACQEAVREVRFGPALGKNGAPVAFDISFTCSFSIY